MRTELDSPHRQVERPSRRAPAGLLVGLCLVSGLLSVAAVDSLAERRSRIAAMSPAERDELARRRERFVALDPAEQKRLRALERQISQDPAADELYQVLERYYEWLTHSLSTAELAELQKVPADERVEYISRLRQQQERRDFRVLTQADLAAVTDWFERVVVNRPSSPGRQRGDGNNSGGRRDILRYLAQHEQGMFPGRSMMRIPPNEFDELKSHLSPEAQAVLDRAGTGERYRLVASWALQAIRSQADAISEEELARYFEKSVSAKDRDRLLRLPVDEMQRQLRWRYLWSQLANSNGEGPGENDRSPEAEDRPDSDER